jgi:hypothetical protein
MFAFNNSYIETLDTFNFLKSGLFNTCERSTLEFNPASINAKSPGFEIRISLFTHLQSPFKAITQKNRRILPLLIQTLTLPLHFEFVDSFLFIANHDQSCHT